jgi:hypothetical protein
MIQHALRTEMIRWWFYDGYTSPKDPERRAFLREQAARYCDILHPCSCSMCGNPRRSGWLNKRDSGTMQERKAQEDFEDQIRDLGEV